MKVSTIYALCLIATVIALCFIWFYIGYLYGLGKGFEASKVMYEEEMTNLRESKDACDESFRDYIDKHSFSI